MTAPGQRGGAAAGAGDARRVPVPRRDRRARGDRPPLPSWVALGVVTLGGAAAATQSAVNAELGARAGDPTLAATVNNLGGCLLVAAALLGMRTLRADLRRLRRAGLPWWAYLGGLGGAAIVVLAAYVVPVVGVAVFTIAQVAGGSFGGLAVDRAGLAPIGRLALTGPRLAGAVLGVVAVALAQLGQPVGDLALGMILLAVAGGVAVALQTALNGRVSDASSATAGVAVNFAVGTPVILLVAALAGALTGPTPTWPDAWYLYTGGLLGVGIVASLVVGVRVVGVLRTGLLLVAGQLGGALVLDALLPAGPGLRLPVLAGALLTLVAALVAGRGAGAGAPGGTPGGPSRVAGAERPGAGGRLVG